MKGAHPGYVNLRRRAIRRIVARVCAPRGTTWQAYFRECEQQRRTARAGR